MFATVDDVRDASYSFGRQFPPNRPSIRGRQSRNSIIRSESVSRSQVELTRVTGKPRYGRDDERFIPPDVVQVAERDREVDFFLFLRGTRQSRNTRRRSDGRVDGVTVATPSS